MSSTRAERERIRELVEPAVVDEGFELVAVELLTLGRRRTLRLTVDRPGGVSLDDCAHLSRLLSPLLDVEDPIEGSYDLEVSSPGMDRPVQRLVDFARFAGYRARFRLSSGPRPRFTGVLRGVEDGRVRVEVDGELLLLPLERIERARLVLDFEEFQRLADDPLDWPEG